MPTGKTHAIYTYTETAQDKNSSFKYKPHLGEMDDSGSWTRDIKDKDRIILSHQKVLLVTCCYQNSWEAMLKEHRRQREGAPTAQKRDSLSNKKK